MKPTKYKYIIIDDHGVAWIENTTMKLVELVLSHESYGDTPAELQTQHLGLTSGQIYSALAYYEDHREHVEAEIQWRMERVERYRREMPEAPIVQRLREIKKQMKRVGTGPITHLEPRAWDNSTSDATFSRDEDG